MSARQQIAGLLGQWLQLTRSESAAIQAAAWGEVRQLQAAKAELQSPLNQALAEWKALKPAGISEHPCRTEVNQLIALEAANSELLASRMRSAGEARLSLARASRNLRRVQRSYAGRPGELWHSYS